MKFLVDAQLPPLLADWIAASGHEAIHVFSVGFHEATDEEIREFAVREGHIIVTKDRDFVVDQKTSQASQLVWVRTGNVSNLELVCRFESAWDQIVETLAQGYPVVEVR